jgi:flagellar hook-associated protein 3 FlgL
MINDRVTTSYQYSRYNSQIQTAVQRLTTFQNQITSGHKFDNLRDDPMNGNLVLNVNSLKSRFTQFDDNLKVAKEYLGTTDQAMSEMTDLLNNVNTLALQGANATTDASTRQSLVEQVNQLQNRLVQIANTQGAGDKYMFAGQNTSTKPYAVDNGTLKFAGDDNSVQVEVRPGERMNVNLPNGSKVFTDTFNRLESLKKNLASGDATALQTNISEVKQSIDTVVSLRGDAGASMQTVKRLSDDNARRIDDLTKQASDAQDVDLADALTQYQSAQLGYQASLQVIASANKYSLLDFLR